MSVLVTVGSTKFDGLVRAIASEDVRNALKNAGYKHVSLQHGNSVVSVSGEVNDGLEVEAWAFRPSLSTEFQEADLVISHAGSGTVLEVLRLGKPMIVVPNDTLADNHQDELADALDSMGYLRKATISTLAGTIATIRQTAFKPFPPPDTETFGRILDEEMGFV